MTIPMAATFMIVKPAIAGGFAKRWIASQAIAPLATSRNIAFANAAKIVERNIGFEREFWKSFSLQSFHS